MSKIAFVFPGQGSQSVGMLAELAAAFPVVEETFREASAALGYDLWALTQNGPEEALNQTFRTQPALLTASIAVWRVWQAEGGALPAVLAGHSLGEYSALVAAGVFSLADAVKLVELRGQAMQDAVPVGTGAMAAVLNLDDAAIRAACAQAAQGQVVAPVNFNSPGQVVIAGNKEAVERAGELCKAAGAKRVLPLPVSVPSHCALMKPAADKLATALQTVAMQVPSLPVINNVDVAAETDPDKIREALVRQLYCPVRWTEVVTRMVADGVAATYECGAGKVLTGLAGRIHKELKAAAINTPASLEAVLAGE